MKKFQKLFLSVLSVMFIGGFLTGCSESVLPKKSESTNVVEAPSEEISYEVQVLVTQNNGEESILDTSLEFEDGNTVMDVMEENFNIETEYDGAFISSINGLKAEDGETLSWFYSVNGEEAMVGANEYELSNGDVVEFDFHSWE